MAALKDYYREMAQRAEDRGDTNAAEQYREPLKQGLVPFRVWQFFNAMVGFVEQSDLTGTSPRPGYWPTTSGMPASRCTGRSSPRRPGRAQSGSLVDGEIRAFIARVCGGRSAWSPNMRVTSSPLIDAKLAGRVDHGLTLCDNGKAPRERH